MRSATAARPRAAPAFTPPPPPTTPPVAPLGGELAALDEVPRAIPVGAPMEVVPLASVLDGRKSGQFQIVLPEEVEGDAIDPDSSAYEISLDDIEIVVAPPDPVALRAEPPRPPEPEAPVPQVPLARLDDELSFSGVFAEVTAPPKPESSASIELSSSDLLPAEAPPPAALPRIPLLSSLPPDRFRYVVEHCELHDVEAGAEIVREGERGGSLFVIASGRVRVSIGGREVGSLGEGDFFGEQAILTDSPRMATVVASEPTQLLEFSRALLSELVANSPDVLRTLLRFFRDRLVERLLGSSALFSSLNRDDARALAERFLFLELEPRMRVVREGERAPGLFLLLCGEAQVLKGQAKLAALGPGDVFGEMSLLAGGSAVASIVTVTKCWALELPRKDFQEIMVSYPQVLAYVSELASRRAADNERIDLI